MKLKLLTLLMGGLSLSALVSAAPPAGLSDADWRTLRKNFSQQLKLNASDGVAGDFFGFAVAVSGDTALIGAPTSHWSSETTSGSAYVFVRRSGTWIQEAKLTVSDNEGAWFGSQVALSGDTALVDNYVFVRSGTTWSQQAKLIIPSDGIFGFFNKKVALSGDTALLGAPFDNDRGIFSGSAYVFVRHGTT